MDFHPAALGRAECIFAIFMAANQQLWLGTTTAPRLHKPIQPSTLGKGAGLVSESLVVPRFGSRSPHQPVLLEEKRREQKLAVAPSMQEGGRAARFSPLPLPVSAGGTARACSAPCTRSCCATAALPWWAGFRPAVQGKRVLPQDLFPCRLWSSSCKSAH